MKKRSIPVIFILISILWLCSFSAADVCQVPKERRKLPDIPFQRALLKYRNGIETLIIEPSMGIAKNDTGWIIPLPNHPIEITKISPGLLKTISIQTQPEFHNIELFENFSEILSITIYIILILVICFIFMHCGIKGGIVPASLFILFVILYPRYMPYHQPSNRILLEPSPNVEPSFKYKGRKIAGNFEIYILEPRNSSELNSWLDRKDLGRMQPEAADLIDSYIAQHWYFAVAKPNTNFNEGKTPHAVMLKFETDKPFYPMKLAALTGSSFFLELFVVGEHQAVPISYNIKKEYCNIFDYKKISTTGFTPESSEINVFMPRKSFKNAKEIAHYDASKVMWDGCVVTKFADTVSDNSIKADMFFNFKGAVPYQRQLYSSKAKFDKAYSNTLSAAAISAIFLTIFYRIIRKRWNKLGIAKNFLLVSIFSVAIFVYSYISLGEITEIYTVDSDSDSGKSVLMSLYFSYPGGTISSGQQLIEFYKQMGINNDITKEPIILEDSPGNIVWEQSGDDIRIKYCNRNGSLASLPKDLPLISVTRRE